MFSKRILRDFNYLNFNNIVYYVKFNQKLFFAKQLLKKKECLLNGCLQTYLSKLV